MSKDVTAKARTGQRPEDRLIEHLLNVGKLDAEGVERARRVSGHSQLSLTKILLELGLVPERELVAEFESGLGIPLADPEEFPLEPVLPDTVTERFLKEHGTILLGADAQNVTVATSDPLDRFMVSALALSTGKKVIVKAALSSDIEQGLRRLYVDSTKDALGASSGASPEATEADLARLRESASEAPDRKSVV